MPLIDWLLDGRGLCALGRFFDQVVDQVDPVLAVAALALGSCLVVCALLMGGRGYW